MRKAVSRIAALAALATLVLATASQAQVPTAEPAASAPVQACAPSDVATPGTACGACGTGRRVGTGQQLFTEATRGIYVAADGYWTACTMPEDLPPPPPPPGCGHGGTAGTPPFAWWKVGENTCTTARDNVTDIHSTARMPALRHGESVAMRQWMGPMRGTVVYRCDAGERREVSAECTPTTHCDTRWSGERDRVRNGRWEQVRFTYDARPTHKRVPIGEYVMATADDESTLRLQCVAGDLVAKPQCVGPQTKGVRWSTHTRVYRYDGEPVEPGALVRMEQTHVVSRDGTSPGTNRIRWTMGRCTPNGQIQ